MLLFMVIPYALFTLKIVFRRINLFHSWCASMWIFSIYPFNGEYFTSIFKAMKGKYLPNQRKLFWDGGGMLFCTICIIGFRQTIKFWVCKNQIQYIPNISNSFESWAWKPILFAAMYLQCQLSMIQLRVLQHTKLNRMNRCWNICRNSSEYVTFHAKQKFHEIHISTIQMRWTCRVSLKRHKNKIDLMFFFKHGACVWRILLICCWKRTDAQNPTL